MKFGMFYPVAVASEADLGKGLWGLDRDRYANTIEELREQAIVADETGWTSMMFAEHHFEIEGYHVTPNPLMLNVYLAQHTKRLRQGQMGLVLPNWNPLRLAEDIAMADHLTGGRLDIGLSRGYQPRSVGVHGTALSRQCGRYRPGEVEAINRKIVEEWFEVMRRSWTEDLWDYRGRIHLGAAQGARVEAPDLGEAQCRCRRRYVQASGDRAQAEANAASADFHHADAKPGNAQLVGPDRQLDRHPRGQPRYRELGVPGLRR